MNIRIRTRALALLPLLALGTAPVPPLQRVVVVYMLGQSNCWGQGSNYSQITNPAYGPSIEDAFIWDKIASSGPHNSVDSGAWQPLTTGYGFQHPPGSNPDAIGAEMQLASRLRVMYQLPVYVIKVARGGASLFRDSGDIDWSDRSHGELLDVWRDAYHRPAIEALYDQGLTPRLVGFLWAQGAADAQESAPWHASRFYDRNLEDLMDELRDEVGIQDAVFAIQRETNLDEQRFPDLDRVRDNQEDVGNDDDDAMWFNSDTRMQGGQTLFEKWDDEHFDGDGQVDMGNAAALAFRIVIDGRPLPVIPRPD